MSELCGFPYKEVQFDKKGNLFDEAEVNVLSTEIQQKEISDLIIVSHGWKNNIDHARQLYTELICNIHGVLEAGSGGRLGDRILGFVGVLWPSMKYTPVKLQPGGGASLDGAITNDMVFTVLESLTELSDNDDAEHLIEQAKNLVFDLEDRKTAQDNFVELIREIMADDEKDDEVDYEVPGGTETKPGREIIDLLSRPGLMEIQEGIGGAAGFGDVFSGIKGGVMNFLNMTTYWKMKKRAGKVGKKGLYDTITILNNHNPDLAIHLVGHSFGGRVVSAAVRGPDNKPSATVKTMSLLQAAFSHNGFAENFDGDRDGYFRRVVTQQRVPGPILITHTKNDKAVGIAYPIASRLSRDDSAALGDENDRFGGIGRNGAQNTAEVVNDVLKDHSGIYDFEAGGIYNLKADQLISDHSDVTNKAIANMIIHNITTPC